MAQDSSRPTAESASPDSISQLFDSKPAAIGPEVIQPSIDDEAHPGDERRTIFMTVFFLVLMVIYVSFCAYYRKGKSRRTVHEEEDRETRRRANQAVIDESQSASERARESAEERAKMEQRKAEIKQVLMIREIVDDAREKKNCSGYWFWETRSDAVRIAKNIITIEEEEDIDEGTLVTSGLTEKIDRKKCIPDIESNSTDETFDSDEHSEAPTSEDAETIKTLDVDNPTTQSGSALPSSSSLKRCKDALDCGACCSHPPPCSLSGLTPHNAGTKNLDVPGHPTITLGEIQSDHAECQICLSQFQVGDMAAWKRHPSSKDEAEGPAEDCSETDCIHVFHEECISR